jgi:hypothetical protein
MVIFPSVVDDEKFWLEMLRNLPPPDPLPSSWIVYCSHEYAEGLNHLMLTGEILRPERKQKPQPKPKPWVQLNNRPSWLKRK